MTNPYVLAVLLAGAFSAGWGVNEWRNDSETLAAQKAIAEVESRVSSILEERLAELKANESTIIREIPKIIKDPVYIIDCFNADGLRTVNAAKSIPAKPAS